MSPATAERANSNGKATLAAPGSITIPPRCKPSRVVSTDRTRPVLCHAYLHRHDGSVWLCATDSYIAVAVKVGGDANEGYVPVGALRLMERGQRAEQISETAWKVWTADGVVIFDVYDQMAGKDEYPDFEKLGVWDEAKPDDVAAPTWPVKVGINPDLMKRIGDGLGAKHGCCFEIVSPVRPIRVVPLGERDRVGIQMPIRLNV